MKKILSAFSICLMAGYISAQAPAQNWCHSIEMMEANFKKHPELRQQYENYQAQLNAIQNTAGNNAQRTAVTDYTIPVVFHVLHQNGIENISDAQIQDQIDIFNRDYNLQNTDTSVVVQSLKNVIGNVHFTFALARLDPNGNCTSGIDRFYDPKTVSWEGNFSDYIYTWDPTKYLNFYVVKGIESGAAGYAYYPGSLGNGSPMDAIVILSSYVGSIGSSIPLHSRALTHEVGHWFNLQHTWGNTNNPGVACGDDAVGDTPVTKGFTSCSSAAASQICTPGVSENYQNYMDYSYCSVMFTNGQVTRMRNAAQSGISSRNNLWSASNLAATGISPVAPCAPAANFSANRLTICLGSSINFTDLSTIATPNTWSWTFEGGTPNVSAVQNPTITYNTPGTYSVQLVSGNSVGSSAPQTKINYITVLPNPISTFISEGFEGSPVPNPIWSIKNASSNVNWEQTSLGAATGNNSVYVDESAMAGSVVELYSPTYNFSAMPNLALTLKWAGAERNATTADYDIFSVQFSTNCGQTWTPRLVKNVRTSTAGVSGVVNGNFVPTAAQFKQEVVPLGSLATLNNVIFKLKFVAESGGSNNFYVDDINLTSSTQIKEDNPVLNFAIYPNPAKDNLFVTFDLLEEKSVEVQLKDVLGRTVKQSAKEQMAYGHHEMPFTITDLSSGIYFVSVNTNGTVTTQKIVIE
jgi:PKD repeat protein